MFDVENKIALITGAAQGIGLQCAKELLRHKLKAVALIDISEENGSAALNQIELEFGKNRAVFYKADVTDKTQFEEAFEKTVVRFGQLDIVINNAGMVNEHAWEKCVAVNLIGTMNGSKIAMKKYLPKYKSGDEGTIVNIASIAGLYPYEPIPVYAATKHGVVGFSRSIAGPIHYEKYKVKVIAVCPGLTATKLMGVHYENQIEEPFVAEWKETLKTFPMQTTQQLAQHVVEIIKNGSSGSVWKVMNNTRTSIDCQFKI